MYKKNFSLIELLIVIGILGVLLTLVLPGFNNTGEDAKDKVARTEMREIQAAFRRFASDVVFRKESGDTNKYLKDIAQYGLWPLMWANHPDSGAGDIVYQEYDSEIGLGRRGPYLREERIVTITAPTGIGAGNSPGQPADDGGAIKIPVIKDPFGGYYRVVVPAARTTDGHDLSEFKRLQKMVLICTGPDQKLDTKVDSFPGKDDPDYTAANADDIVAAGDDIVIRLMPLAGY